jgi:hypothetical protein
VNQPGWHLVINEDDEAVPPFGVMEVTGVNENGLATVTRPTQGDRPDLVLINGPAAIFPGAAGQGHRDYPAIVAYEAQGDDETRSEEPDVGEWVGPRTDSWLLHRGKRGFVVIGGSSDGLVNVIQEKRIIPRYGYEPVRLFTDTLDAYTRTDNILESDDSSELGPFDGETPIVGDRILYNQSSAHIDNGIYEVLDVGEDLVSGSGSGATDGRPWRLRRTWDLDDNDDLDVGYKVVVQDGDDYAGTTWRLIRGAVVNTTTIHFENEGSSEERTVLVCENGTLNEYRVLANGSVELSRVVLCNVDCPPCVQSGSGSGQCDGSACVFPDTVCLTKTDHGGTNSATLTHQGSGIYTGTISISFALGSAKVFIPEDTCETGWLQIFLNSDLTNLIFWGSFNLVTNTCNPISIADAGQNGGDMLANNGWYDVDAYTIVEDSCPGDSGSGASGSGSGVDTGCCGGTVPQFLDLTVVEIGGAAVDCITENTYSLTYSGSEADDWVGEPFRLECVDEVWRLHLVTSGCTTDYNCIQETEGQCDPLELVFSFNSTNCTGLGNLTVVITEP